MREIIKKLRKYEVRIRKAVINQLQGDFHSIFKGSGLEFDDIRQYQYGDDVRTIDWKVTAKGHGTYVKTFKEEKEQTVYFLLDVSASQQIGKPGKQKEDIAKEICGVLTLSSVKESSQVGLICFSDRKEKYVKPGKGIKHAYQLISEMYNLKPESKKTNLSLSIKNALGLIKKRSVIVMVSDFIDNSDYEKELRALSQRHDLIVIHLSDKQETSLPKLGITPLYDKESGQTVYVNTSSPAFRSLLRNTFLNNTDHLANLCKRFQSSYLSIDTSEDYVPQLIKLFKLRKRRKKSA